MTHDIIRENGRVFKRASVKSTEFEALVIFSNSGVRKAFNTPQNGLEVCEDVQQSVVL